MKNSKNQIIEITSEVVVNMIHEIRGQKVMLDFELAELYGYETRSFNQQIKRNINRFPEEFMFKLTSKEVKECRLSQIVTASTNAFRNKSDKPYAFTEQGVYMLMRSQIVTTSIDTKSRRKDSLPYAFTEQGIYMLMTVLKDEIVVKKSSKRYY